MSVFKADILYTVYREVVSGREFQTKVMVDVGQSSHCALLRILLLTMDNG